MPEVVRILEVEDYGAAIARAAEMINRGDVVVLPTETVYGAAALLSRPQGSSRLRALRASTETRPFAVHLAAPGDAMRFLGPVSPLGRRMMAKLWPGPVALVFDVPAQRRAAVAADTRVPLGDLYDGSMITLRCPEHTVTCDVLAKVNGPVALTLVDSGDWGQLDNKVDLVFDGGAPKYAKPSTIVRVFDDRYEIVREGAYDRRIVERLMRTTVLFVCSGNTCRSPIAEALTRHLLAQKLGLTEPELEKKGIVVLSAGGFALPGAKATPQAVDAVQELGADLSRHRTRPLSVELINQADWVFTMGKAHAVLVTALVPSAAAKTHPLDPNGEVEDPIGGDVQMYKTLARRLKQLIEEQVMGKMVG